MWVKRIEIDGFLGAEQPLVADFNRDLNIITGRNGAGKTTLMKLMWYIMSGNLLLALREVPFSRAKLVTSEYSCTVHRIGDQRCWVEVIIDEKTTTYEDVEHTDGEIYDSAEDLAAEVLIPLGSSIFLPTFRRIEGGFTLKPALRKMPSGISRQQGRVGTVEEALDALSSKISKGSHKFVAAISTGDLVEIEVDPILWTGIRVS